MKNETHKASNNTIKPFWSWNDELQKEELCNQIDAMHSVGIGGFFMHARGGLVTEYMSDDWFDCIKACLDRSDELAMQAWAYDENGWPSGFANGEVPKKGIDYQQKWLVYSIVQNESEIPENLIGLYRVEGETVKLLESYETGCIAISYGVNPYYIDTFNRECVAYFIECTHRKYYDKFGKSFGNSLKGFFTDEPQYGNGNKVPWSQVFEDFFRNKYGYEMLPELPLLFLESHDSYRFRYDYYNMVSTVFRESFIKQMYDWCTEHNCKLTGHMMNEEGLVQQMYSTAGVMSCYEYFHEPGIDWLNRAISGPIVPKQLGSVASQLGRKTLSESFALCGWDVSLNELKWIAQWQLVNGVTSFCPHLAAYSIRGYRKRDYPPSLFTQLPWFKKGYPELSGYLSRIGEILDGGNDIAPLLMIHPIQSAFLLRNPQDCGPLYELDKQFFKITHELKDNHILHHYGDESVISHHASVEVGLFKIGKCSYSAVLLPSIINIASFTADLLLEFADGGGMIYCVGEALKFIDGRIDSRVDRLLNSIKFVNDIAELKAYDSAKIVTDGKENGNIHYCVKNMPNGETVYYLVNLSNEEQTVMFSVKGKVPLGNWDISLDKLSPVKFDYIDNFTVAELKFSPYGSYILKNSKAEFNTHSAKEIISLNNIFEVTDCSPNALTLDTCKYRIDGGEWQPEKAIILLQNELLQLRHQCDVDLKFSFTVEDGTVLNNLNLCIETPEKYKFTLNGTKIDFADNGYFTDNKIRSMSILPFIKKGVNEIVLSVKFYQNDNVYRVLFTKGIHETELNKLTYDTELESIYLTGDFGVHMDGEYRYGERRCIYGGRNFKITNRKKKLDISKITEQDYWFFAGEIKLTQKISINKKDGTTYLVSLKKLNAPAAELFVNGNSAGLLAFAPFEKDVTEFLRDGENEISFNLLSGNRNLLGPHHKPYGESYSVGPATFTDKIGWSDPQNLPTWTDDYSFVLFGIEF